MSDLATIKAVSNMNKYTQAELEMCIMISNRFTDGDLFNAANELNKYKHDPDSKFLKAEIKEFISEF